jgi:hypothetical protein
VKDYAADFLNPVERAREKKLAAEKKAGLIPDAITVKDSPIKGVVLESKVGGNGQQKLVGRCPACAEEGRDKQGKHLVVFPGGRFGCSRFEASAIEGPERTEHLRKIWKLAGGNWNGVKLDKPQAMDPAEKERRLKMRAMVLEAWKATKEKFAMDKADWLATSADLPGSPQGDFEFACSIWTPGQLAWFGTRYDCSAAFPRHLFEFPKHLERAWEMVEVEGLDHACGIGFKAGSTSRHKNNHAGVRFLVVEHDEDGIEGQIALVRYLESLGFRLILCVSTGNRGFHAWFDADGITPQQIESTAFLLECIGADKGAFLRASTRTPGAIRQNQYDGKPFGMRQPIIFIPKN